MIFNHFKFEVFNKSDSSNLLNSSFNSSNLIKFFIQDKSFISLCCNFKLVRLANFSSQFVEASLLYPKCRSVKVINLSILSISLILLLPKSNFFINVNQFKLSILDILLKLSKFSIFIY